MPNVARPSTGPGPEADGVGGEAVLDGGVAAALLDAVRAARRGEPALPGLSPSDYARAHARFEACSDQRGTIADHLVGHLGTLLDTRSGTSGGEPLSVLSVGCGDGSLDTRVAAGLVDSGAGERPVRWVGVEPFAGSAAAFTAAMADLGRASLRSAVHHATFAEADLAGPFDVVVLAHSMYYVPDVADTLGRARALLRSAASEVVVVHAPRGALNELVDVLAPPTEGHRQWFSDDVAAGFSAAGLVLDPVETLAAGVALHGADDDVLDFAVQARLTPALRGLVRDYLDAIGTGTGPGSAARRVPHPVDVLTGRRAAQGTIRSSR